MTLIISENFKRFIFSNKNFVIPISWSLLSQRGIKSYEEIPRAPQVCGHGSMPYLYESGGQTYLHKYIDGLHKTLGPIFVANLKKDIVFIADPESNVKIFKSEGKYPKRLGVESWKLYFEDTDQRSGLYFLDDEKWLEARKVFNKILLKPDSMKYHVKSVSKVCKDFVEVLKKRQLDTLKYQIYYWNVECIGEIALGNNFAFIEALMKKDSDLINLKENRAFVDSLLQVHIQSAKLAEVQQSLASLKQIKLEPWLSFCDAMSTMLKYGEQYVRRGIHTIISCAEDCLPSDEHMRESVVYKALIEEKMDVNTLKEVLLDHFLGSTETTCNTALWTIYLLGRNPEEANKARKQICSVLKNEKDLSLSTLKNIPFLDGIIRESLRLYSVAPFIDRILPKDVELCNYLIPAGTTVMSSLFTMGRDPTNYTDPESFRPERWFSAFKEANENIVLNWNAFTPFALEERSCVGRKIAELKLSLLLMELLKNFEWTVEEEMDSILKINIVPDKELKVNFKKIYKV